MNNNNPLDESKLAGFIAIPPLMYENKLLIYKTGEQTSWIQIKIYNHKRLSCTHNAVGHEVMPVKLPATVVLLVEILHLWNQIFQLCRKRDKNLLAAPRPRSSVQDLNVDRVSWWATHRNTKSLEFTFHIYD